MDLASRVLTYGNKRRRLTPSQASVMFHLLHAAPTAVSHDALWRAVRGHVPAITTSAVRTLICELRKACKEVLGEDAIEAVHAKGYRLRLDDRPADLTSVSGN